MAELIVEIDNNADGNILSRIIRNIRGVRNVSFRRSDPLITIEPNINKNEEWLRKMESLGGVIDSDILDMNDERTRYILSK